MCSLCDPAAGPFLAPGGGGHNLNKICRGPLGDATIPNIKALSMPFGFRQVFYVFPTEAYVQHVTPKVVPFLALVA